MGEPLLIPKKDLEEIFSWGYKIARANAIQTKGTLIDDDHILLFKRFNVHVGISIDGPGELKLNEILIVHEALNCVGIDPGFGSSNTGIVITEHLKNPDVVRVIYAEEFEKANPQDIVDLCYDFHRQYYPNIRFLVDGSNAGFVRQLKVVFGEDPDYDYKDVSPETMEILPISFNVSHKEMLSHLYLMVNEGLLAIPDKYEKLIISLRTAQNKDYSLWKDETSYDDLLDGLRLSLKGYKIR